MGGGTFGFDLSLNLCLTSSRKLSIDISSSFRIIVKVSGTLSDLTRKARAYQCRDRDESGLRACFGTIDGTTRYCKRLERADHGIDMVGGRFGEKLLLLSIRNSR